MYLLKEKIMILDTVSRNYGYEFLLPPVDGDIKNPVFIVDDIQKSQDHYLVFVRELMLHGFEITRKTSRDKRHEYIKVKL